METSTSIIVAIAILALLVIAYYVIVRRVEYKGIARSGYGLSVGLMGFLLVVSLAGSMVMSAVVVSLTAEEFLGEAVEFACVYLSRFNSNITAGDYSGLYEGLDRVTEKALSLNMTLWRNLGDALNATRVMRGYVVAVMRGDDAITGYAVLLYGEGQTPGDSAYLIVTSKDSFIAMELQEALAREGYAIRTVGFDELGEERLDRIVKAMASEVLEQLIFREAMMRYASNILMYQLGGTPSVGWAEAVAVIPGSPSTDVLRHLSAPGPHYSLLAVPVGYIGIDLKATSYFSPASPLASELALSKYARQIIDLYGAGGYCYPTAGASEALRLAGRLYDVAMFGSLIVLGVFVAAAALSAGPIAFNSVILSSKTLSLIRLRGVNKARMKLFLLRVGLQASALGAAAGVALVLLLPVAAGLGGSEVPGPDKQLWLITLVAVGVYTLILWHRSFKVLETLELGAAARGQPLASQVPVRIEPPGTLGWASLILGAYHALRGLLGLPFIYEYVGGHGPLLGEVIPVVVGVLGFIERATYPIAPVLLAYGVSRVLEWHSPGIYGRLERVLGGGRVAAIASGLARWLVPRARGILALLVIAAIVATGWGTAHHILYTGAESAVYYSVGAGVVAYKVLEPEGEGYVVDPFTNETLYKYVYYNLTKAAGEAVALARECGGALPLLVVPSYPMSYYAEDRTWESVEDGIEEPLYIVLDPSALDKLHLEEFLVDGSLEDIDWSSRRAVILATDMIRSLPGTYKRIALTPTPQRGWLGVEWISVKPSALIRGLPTLPVYAAIAETYIGGEKRHGVYAIYFGEATAESLLRGGVYLVGDWVLEKYPNGLLYWVSQKVPPLILIVGGSGCESRLAGSGFNVIAVDENTIKEYIEGVSPLLEVASMVYYLWVAAVLLLALTLIALSLASHAAYGFVSEILSLVRLRGAGPRLALTLTATLWGVLAAVAILIGVLAGIGAGVSVMMPAGSVTGAIGAHVFPYIFNTMKLELGPLEVEPLWALASPSLGVEARAILMDLALFLAVVIPPFISGLRVFYGEAYRSIGRR